MKSLNMAYNIIAVFDCGCEYDPSIGDVFIIQVKSLLQRKHVSKLLQLHSPEHQCDPKGVVYKGTIKGNVLKSETDIRVLSYEEFLDLWRKEHQERVQLLKEYTSSREKDYFSKRHQSTLFKLEKSMLKIRRWEDENLT